MTRWADVDPPWRAALELAWAAYAADTIPVGVVVDASGEIVAEGQNAVYRPGAVGPLAGSRLAHAEVAALGSPSAEGAHEDRALYASLEPCLLCVGAAVPARRSVARSTTRSACSEPRFTSNSSFAVIRTDRSWGPTWSTHPLWLRPPMRSGGARSARRLRPACPWPRSSTPPSPH